MLDWTPVHLSVGYSPARSKVCCSAGSKLLFRRVGPHRRCLHPPRGRIFHAARASVGAQNRSPQLSTLKASKASSSPPHWGRGPLGPPSQQQKVESKKGGPFGVTSPWRRPCGLAQDQRGAAPSLAGLSPSPPPRGPAKLCCLAQSGCRGMSGKRATAAADRLSRWSRAIQ